MVCAAEGAGGRITVLGLMCRYASSVRQCPGRRPTLGQGSGRRPGLEAFLGAGSGRRPSLDAALEGRAGRGLALRRYSQGSTSGGSLRTYPVRTVPTRVVLDGRQRNGGT